MSGTPGQKSLVTLAAHTGTIALIAIVMLIGVAISDDDDTGDFSIPGTGSISDAKSPGPPASASGTDFGGNSDPAGRDLTTQEERDLISRRWQ